MPGFGKCKLTGKDGQFIKAHVLPKSFFLLSRNAGDNRPFKLVSASGAHPPKRSWDGVYDDALVIAEGEDFFDPLDSYAFSLLSPPPTRSAYVRDEHGFIAKSDEGGRLAYAIPNYDYQKLRLFFDSLLWRISACEKPYFQAARFINEEDLREAILRQQASPRKFYDIIIMRHFGEWSTLNFSPHKWESDGVVGIKVICGTFAFHFLFEGAREKFDECLMKEGSPLVIFTARLLPKEVTFARKAVAETAQRWRK